MAFGSNKKLEKQDLIDAGLDPEKFNNLIGTAVTKDDLNALKTEFTTAVDSIKNMFADLETKLKPKTPETTTTTTTEDQPTDFDRFTTDPTKFVKDEAGKVALAAAVEIKKTTRSIAFNNALNTLPYMKNAAIRKEVEEEWAKYSPELMARNNADPEKLIDQIYKMVIGNHHEEIVQDRDKKDGKFNLVHSGSSSGGGGNGDGNNRSTTNDTPTLTDAQKEVARKFGLSEADYIKQQADSREEEKTRRLKVGA